MSARAAWRLEGLGFSQVYRYTAGKSDWGAAGLPLAGQEDRLTAGRLARKDVPTCRPDEKGTDVAARVTDGPVVVVNAEGVVLGAVGQEHLQEAGDGPVERTMHQSPMTVRPDVGLPDVLAYLETFDLQRLLVTDGDGHLVGAVLRQDVEPRLPDEGRS